MAKRIKRLITVLLSIAMVLGVVSFSGGTKAEAEDYPLKFVDSDGTSDKAVTANIMDGKQNTVTSFRVKNTGGTDITGVTMIECSEIRSVDENGDETVEPVFSFQSYPCPDPVNAEYDYYEGGYTIKAGKTATFYVVVNPETGSAQTRDYNYWFKLGKEHRETEYTEAGWVDELVVDAVYTNNIPVKVHVYTPQTDFRITGKSPLADSSSPALNKIDFGTINLADQDEDYAHMTSRTLYYLNNSSVQDPYTGEVPDIDINWIRLELKGTLAGYTDYYDGGELFGWSGGERSKISPREGNSYGWAETTVSVYTGNAIAGTYTADLVLTTVPRTVKANNGNIANDPQTGELRIPVTVTLTGVNPRLPGRVENFRAKAGNGRVTLTWDPSAEENAGEIYEYHIYRRDGIETGEDPDRYDYRNYEEVGTTDSTQGMTFTDWSAENGKTYSYVVIPGEPYRGYASAALTVTPTDRAIAVPRAPGLVSAEGQIGYVGLFWYLNEDRPLDVTGEDEIDHFNIYRNGQLVQQVDQNAYSLSTSGFYDYSSGHPVYVEETRAEWGCLVPSESGLQYEWSVTAVNKDGVEGPESPHFSAGAYVEEAVITGYDAWYYENGSDDTHDDQPVVQIHVDSAGYYNLREVKVWRDGVFLGSVDKNHVIGYRQYDFADWTVKKGKTYRYEVSAVDEIDRETPKISFTVKTSAVQGPYGEDDYWISSPQVEQTILNGNTMRLTFPIQEGEVFRVYRDNKLVRTYSEAGYQVFTDIQEKDGTYVYRVDKTMFGQVLSSPDFVMRLDHSVLEFDQKPDPPTLSARVVGYNGSEKVVLSWTGPSTGSEIDGYYVYRTDNGKVNTSAFNRSDGYWSTMYGSEPAQGRYLRLYKGKTGYTDTVYWGEENLFPVKYWVCAYNQYGVSNPSEVIIFNYNNGSAPANTDTLKPGKPVITGLEAEYPESFIEDDSCWAKLAVAWRPAGSGGGADRYEILYERYNTENKAWETYDQETVYPDGQELKSTAYVQLPRDYGKYRVSVSAVNRKGKTASSKTAITVNGVPQLLASPKTAASVQLEWTAPYQDNTLVQSFEVFRREEYGLWEKTLTITDPASVYDAASGRYVLEDTGLREGTKYFYYVNAVTAKDVRTSLTREVTPSRDTVVPRALTNLRASAVGMDGTILLRWDTSAEGGKAETICLQYRNQDYDPNNAYSSEWYSYSSIDGESSCMMTWANHETVRVVARNEAGYGPPSNEITLNFSDEELNQGSAYDYTYNYPSNVMPYVQETGDGWVTLAWNAQGGGGYAPAVLYEIERLYTTEEGQEIKEIVGRLPAEGKSVTFTDIGLQSGVRYRYRVNCVSSIGSYYYGMLDYSVVVVLRGESEAHKAAVLFAGVIRQLPEVDQLDLADAEQVDQVQQAGSIFDQMLEKEKEALDNIDQMLAEKLRGLVAKVNNAQAEADYANEAAAMRALIEALPDAAGLTEAALSDEAVLAQITAARQAYDKLPEAVKPIIDLTRLTAAEEKIASLRQEAGDREAIDRVLAAINALPAASKITAANAERTLYDAETARTLYESLLPRQQQKLQADSAGTRALKKLKQVEDKLLNLEAELAEQERRDREAVTAVAAKIEPLRDTDGLKLSDLPAVEQARAAYEALTDEQKGMVTDDLRTVLARAEERMGVLQEADAVSQMISALSEGEITLERRAEVEAARAALEGLSDAAKALITPLELEQLEAAEEQIAWLEKAEADRAEAQRVSGLIEGLDEVRARAAELEAALEAAGDLSEEEAGTLADLIAQTEAVRAEYNALTAEQKGLLDNAAKIDETEQALGTLSEKAAEAGLSEEEIQQMRQAAQAAADQVIAQIEALGDISRVDPEDAAAMEAAGAAIAEARAAYDALTAEQKALVTNAAALTEAEHTLGQLMNEEGRKAIEEAKRRETDRKAAAAVADQIRALPSAAGLTLADEKAVNAARQAYNGLTEAQKALIDNSILNMLTAAEARIAELKEGQDPVVAFVTRLYQVCLDREPDEGGLNNWVRQLKAKTITGVQAASGFIFSQEFKNKNFCNTCFVKQLYRAFMGREYDQGGLNNWVRQLESGKKREEVFNGFALSAEFNNLCTQYGITRGSGIGIPRYGTVPKGPCSSCGEIDGVTAFVTRLYRVCLDREPDAGGLNDWTNQLWDHRRTGKSAAFGFVFSAEFQNKKHSNAKFVDYMYAAFFGREPDAAGKAGWVRQLNAGKSREAVFNGFADSQEFTNLCARYGITAR